MRNLKKPENLRTAVLIFLSVCTFLFPAVFFAQTSEASGVQLHLNQQYLENSSLIIDGTILQKEEIWNRRSNPLIGRPDFLVEIQMRVSVHSIFKGSLPEGISNVDVSIKGQDLLIRYKGLPEGKRGVFYLSGTNAPFELVGFEPKPGQPVPDSVYSEKEISNYLLYPEKISGRVIIRSRELQKRVAAKIARKYRMKDAVVLTMVSFSGPMPPQGGYVYWGVKGRIGEKWYIWVPGSNGRLREGQELIDPHRYDKCNSPQTLILTPSGPVAVKDVRPGDRVLTGDGRAVPVLRVSRSKAVHHRICRLKLSDGTVMEISPGHPLADGRLIGELQGGDMVSGRQVLENNLVPYVFDYTYDILPDSASGTYFANGVLVGSTLFEKK